MGFSRGYLTVCAALALALALPAGVFAAEPKGTLKLSCEEGKLLSLEARAALAPDVFRALEKECGLQLKGGWNIPDEPVTATYEKVTLEEIIESLIRLAGLPSTLLAIASSGALKLAVLATGTPRPKKPRATVSREERDGARDEDSDDEDVPEEALEGARRRYLLAKTDAERQVALEDLLEMDADELADEREEAAIESALEKYYLAKTDLERQRAYEELKKIDPDEAEDLLD